MIHEVRINFPKIAKSKMEALSDQLLENNSNLPLKINSIISDLNQRPESFSIVFQVVYGLSAKESLQKNKRIQTLASCLTKRELEILGLAIDGFSNKLISDKLFITVETVKSHRKSIVNKAGVARIEEIKNWLLNDPST